jgi:two-component system, LytTR family, sensor kinase
LDLKTIRYRDLLGAFAAFWVFWAVVQALVVYHSFGLDLKAVIQDSLLTSAMLALASYAMVNILRFYQPRQFLRVIYSIGIAFISMLVMKWLATYVITDNKPYEVFLRQSFLIRTLFAWLIISLFTASAWLWFSFRDHQEVEDRKHANEKLAREAELSRLRQQLQPHFLFNSLNSISALVVTKPEEARKMIQQLSDFLRGTLKKDDQQLVPLTEEVDHLQLYLEIEKVRFGHRLRTELQHDEQSRTMKIPPLLLQPVVENAIKFGLYDTTGEITIRIMTHAEGQYLVVGVENPFDPETARPKQGTGFGLNSVQRRLYLLFARQDLLSTTQNNQIFRTTIKIPQVP